MPEVIVHIDIWFSWARASYRFLGSVSLEALALRIWTRTNLVSQFCYKLELKSMVHKMLLEFVSLILSLPMIFAISFEWQAKEFRSEQNASGLINKSGYRSSNGEWMLKQKHTNFVTFPWRFVGCQGQYQILHPKPRVDSPRMPSLTHECCWFSEL